MNKKEAYWVCRICGKHKKDKEWSLGKETLWAGATWETPMGKTDYAIIPQPVCQKCLDELKKWQEKRRKAND